MDFAPYLKRDAGAVVSFMVGGFVTSQFNFSAGACIEITVLKDVPDVLSGHLGAKIVRVPLNSSSKVDLQSPGQFDAVFGFEQVGDTSLPDWEFTRITAS